MSIIILAGMGLFLLTSLIWSIGGVAYDEPRPAPPVVNDAQHPDEMGMRVTRVFSGSDEESHFEDVDIAMARMSNGDVTVLQGATGTYFQRTDKSADWHTAPKRLFLVILDGVLEMVIGDGTKRQFHTGDVVLVEDVTGHWHISRGVGGAPRKYMYGMLE
jgi:quercetin dioxygenase-like cupin family protein